METAAEVPAEMDVGGGSAHLFLGIKLQPGPIERHRLENFSLDNTVHSLKQEAGNRAKVDTAVVELIHHGRVLEDLTATLSGLGVRNGEMVHVVRKRGPPAVDQPLAYTDAELQQIVSSLRAFGCTPNAPGWTRAMQVLNDEERLEELLEAVPGLADDCSSLSILHEIELLAALGATLSTMRRGAAALPSLPAALKHLGLMLRAHPPPSSSETAPTSGFAYSLEALSEDEDGEEDDEEAGSGSRTLSITQEQVAAALRMAQENISSPGGSTSLLQLLRGAGGGAAEGTDSAPQTSTPVSNTDGSRRVITSEMFSSAVAEALNRAVSRAPADEVPMEHSTTASSSQSPGDSSRANPDDYTSQLRHMHDMGLLDDAVNLRALLICNGDVNAAINFVFTSMEE